MKLSVKWVFNDLPNVVMTKNRELWQMPFESSDGKKFGWRQIEGRLHNGIIHYLISGKRYSVYQLNRTAKKKEHIIETNQLSNEDCPF